jgi:hypothetical protein
MSSCAVAHQRSGLENTDKLLDTARAAMPPDEAPLAPQRS